MPSVEEKKAKVNAEIQELRKKIQLSEGQNKAYYEESEAEKESSKEKVRQLRKDIKELRLEIHEAKQGNEKAVEEAFQSRRKRASVSAPSSSKAVKPDTSTNFAEYRLHDYIKRLNLLQHNAKQKEQRLSYLNKHLEEAGHDRAKIEKSAIDEMKKEHVRLQNEMDRLLVQVNEGEAVRQRYNDMISTLKSDSVSHGTFIEVMQTDISQEKDSIKHFKEGRRNAERTRDDLRTLLHQEEDKAFSARRERERKLEDYRKKVDEKVPSEGGMATDRKLSLLRTPQRLSPTLGFEGAETSDRINVDLEKFLHLLSKLKDVLGVTSVDQVVDRLKTQKYTRDHLQTLRDCTLQELNKLKQEKEFYQQELHRVKYEATEDSAKLDGVFGEIENKKTDLLDKKQELEETLEEALKVLGGARATLEHLVELLSDGDEDEQKLLDKTSEMTNDYVTQLKNFSLTKTKKYLEEISEIEESEDTERELAMDDFCLEMDQGPITSVPDNVRVPFYVQKGVKITGPQAEEAGDSGEEEEALARRLIKRQAQTIVETKSRKRTRTVATFRT